MLECNMALSVWALKDDDVAFPVYGDETDDPKLWSMSLSRTLSQQEFVELLTTLWAIWWAWRKLIHEQEYQSPISTHAFIVRYLNELNSVSLKENTKVGNSRVRVPCSLDPTTGGDGKD